MKHYQVGIIGGNGFVATHLITTIKDLGLSVIVYGRTKPPVIDAVDFVTLDLLDERLNSRSKIHVDKLIFNSANKGRFADGTKEWIEQGKVSAPDFDLLSTKLNLSFDRLMTIGSSEEYGARETDLEINESDTLKPISSYGFWKAKLYENGLHWADAHGAEFIHLRPFNLFAVDGDPQMFLKQIVSNLTQQKVFKMTAGEQYRSFVSIKTLEKVIAALLKKSSWLEFAPSHAINLSEPHYYQLKDVAKILEAMILGSRVEMGALQYRKDEVWHQKPNLRAIKRLLGEHYQTDFISELKDLL